jgi:hypothetical protein
MRSDIVSEHFHPAQSGRKCSGASAQRFWQVTGSFFPAARSDNRPVLVRRISRLLIDRLRVETSLSAFWHPDGAIRHVRSKREMAIDRRVLDTLAPLI